MFKEAGNTAVFTTKFVLFENKEITTVYHDEDDGAWQFFSADHFDNYEEVAKIACLDEIIAMDESISKLSEMPKGYFAYRRSRLDKWTIQKRT